MKRSTKGKRILQAYSGDPPPFELPHGSSITKLTQVHGLSQKGRIRLEVLDFTQTHPVASPVKDRHSPKPPFGGRKITPETSKARKDKSRSPKRSGSPNGP